MLYGWYQFGRSLFVLSDPSLMIPNEFPCALDIVNLTLTNLTFSEGRMKAGVAWQLSLLKMAPS